MSEMPAWLSEALKENEGGQITGCWKRTAAADFDSLKKH
jgi:hypothetical protein